mgnify:FL=1|jgi:hypothetical protein
MNVKRLVKEIARLEKSDDVLALKALKKELDTLKKAPANAIRNSIGVNEKGFTRFNHKPDNMIVTARDAGKIIGSINWEGQRWDWGLTVRTPSPAIQKVVTINPFI